jgi:hypothetical protein
MPWSWVKGVDPEPGLPRSASPRRQYGDGCVISPDHPVTHGVCLDRCRQATEPPGAAADPVGQRLALDLHPLARQDGREAVKWQAVEVLRHQHVGQQARARSPLLDGQVGYGRMENGLAGPAGIARPDVADDLQPRRDLLQHLRDVLAELRQARRIGAAAAAGEYRLVQDGLPRQVLRQRLAERRTARLAGLSLRLSGLGCGSTLRLVLLEITDQHLELADLAGELFGGLAVAVASQAGELDFQLLDFIAGIAQFALTFDEDSIALSQRGIAFRQQRPQRGDLGLRSVERRDGHSGILRHERGPTTLIGYTAASGRAVQAGMRQSMPSTSIESCAGVRDTAPLPVRGQTNLPFSSRLATRIRP